MVELHVVVDPDRGILKDDLHSETVGLEIEMVVATVKHMHHARFLAAAEMQLVVNPKQGTLRDVLPTRD